MANATRVAIRRDVECATCGCVFTAFRSTRRYCPACAYARTLERNRSRVREDWSRRQAICAHCGAPSHSRFCSTRCGTLARYAGKRNMQCAISGCERDTGGRSMCNTHRIRSRLGIATCEFGHCDAPAVKGEATCAPHRPATCAVVYATCHCGALYVKRRTTSIHCRRRAPKTQPTERPCVVCGVAFSSTGQRIICHSEACRKRRLRQGDYYKRRKKIDKHVRRARLKGVEAERIDPIVVYERDGWRCQLCGKRVLRGIDPQHAMSASLDHIVPLAAGGAHVMSNVQLAHRVCNTRKGTGPAQLRLAV